MMDQMSDSNDRILEKAYEPGVKYEKECTGCAQTVVAAISLQKLY